MALSTRTGAVDRRLARELLESALGLIGDRTDTLDLKIAEAALAEMRDAFAMFAPYRDVPKVTVFGSARTRGRRSGLRPGDRRSPASWPSAAGWSSPVPAPASCRRRWRAPAASAASACRSDCRSSRRANPIIAGDEKSVSMKYFFTRKLMLVKESRAFVSLPGGFGTLDETFELLTLTQTGKGLPVPIVLLDAPGDPFWAAHRRLRAHPAHRPRAGQRGRFAPLPRHRRRATRRARRSSASTPTTTRSATSATRP